MSEQADALASGGLSELADFLSDTPEMESEDESSEIAEESTGEDADTETEADDNSDDDSDDAEESADDDEPEATTVDRKIKVPERHPDGTVTEIEVTEKELIAGYERQAAFTRKTQALAERETEAVKFLTQKHEEVRNHYLSQAELARAAVTQMAGIKTESEMAQLANSDPAAWVAESQRQQAVAKFLSQLDQQINGERTKAEQEAAQARMQSTKQAYERTWAELQKDGIDRDKLAKIYGNVTKNYGFSEAELASVYDHRQVRLMKDAIAFRELQAQKAAVTKKVQEAPRMPSKQTSPAQTRQDQALENKFKGGRAKLNDLAAYLR